VSILQSSCKDKKEENKQKWPPLPFSNQIINTKLTLDSPLSDDKELSDYKDLLNHVSDNVEDYNDQIIEKKDRKLANDDLVEMKESSTQFISDCSSSSDNDSSFLKDSGKWRSPKLRNHFKLDTTNLDNLKNQIRITKRTKQSFKFKFKGNTQNSPVKKPNSPDIK
jgi:hypothetical protein